MSEIAAERRQQIIAAAAVCFARRGFHGATMPEICAEAKLSPGTVYRLSLIHIFGVSRSGRRLPERGSGPAASANEATVTILRDRIIKSRD